MTIMALANPIKGSRLMGTLLAVALLGSCAGAPSLRPTQDSSSSGAGATGAMDGGPSVAPAAELAASPATKEASEPGTDMGQLAPQLVKQANLVLLLTDVDQAVTQVQEMVQKAGGDLLNLQDYRSPDGIAHQITLTLRVPQAQLESVLAAIRPLGTVQQQSLTAEDVSTQLVDIDARLKNLRQAEATLLTIMERSGKISEVLEVARELSTVRESIERLAAQQQSLQQRVTYAQINLTLQSPVVEVPPLRPIGETLGQTWRAASQSVKAFTVSGLQVALWLLAYSPYLVVVATLLYGGYRWRFRRSLITAPSESE